MNLEGEYQVSNRNCLSYWFPRIQAAGLPVPRTEIVRTECELLRLVDGTTPPGYHTFIQTMQQAAGQMGGFPCFLRTGQTSGKHDWKHTCYVAAAKDLGQHVFNLVEFSECCCLEGLPYDVWVVRELIDTRPAFVAFSGMPIAREFRIFTRDNEPVCIHPYWPKDTIQRPTTDDWVERLAEMSEIDEATAGRLKAMARTASLATDYGDWSVDFLEDVDGNWWLIDMAEAAGSWHWPDCEFKAGNET